MPRAVMRSVIGSQSSRNATSFDSRTKFLLLVASAVLSILVIKGFVTGYTSNGPLEQSTQPQPPGLPAGTRITDKGALPTGTGAGTTLMPVPQSQGKFLEKRDVEGAAAAAKKAQTEAELKRLRTHAERKLSKAIAKGHVAQAHWQEPTVSQPVRRPQRPVGWGRRRAPGGRRVP